jgi:hypothetical protein
MSLSDFIQKSDNHEQNFPLAKFCSKLELEDDIHLFNELYKEFNNYSLEMTISPKSSPILNQRACRACGATSLRDIDQQNKLMDKLLDELIQKFKINILGVTELYKDNKNIHTHNIISPCTENTRKKIKDYVKNYYQLYNNVVIILRPINDKKKYKEYMLKELNFQYHYYNENKERSLEKIKNEYEQKQADRKNKIYSDPILLHLNECAFDNCPICNWINKADLIEG